MPLLISPQTLVLFNTSINFTYVSDLLGIQNGSGEPHVAPNRKLLIPLIAASTALGVIILLLFYVYNRKYRKRKNYHR